LNGKDPINDEEEMYRILTDHESGNFSKARMGPPRRERAKNQRNFLLPWMGNTMYVHTCMYGLHITSKTIAKICILVERASFIKGPIPPK